MLTIGITLTIFIPRHRADTNHSRKNYAAITLDCGAVIELSFSSIQTG
jgi:hypothetical protein